MLVMSTVNGVRARRAELEPTGRRLAFVPTMGALHDGHLALVRRGLEVADEVWVSVFVNPTQFGPGEDFDRYPRDLERDRALLDQAGATLLFAPSAKEMYPSPTATLIDLPELTRGLCGAHRPGHFGGVALVVTKLLNIVQPHVAVFGAKDWQQAAVIRRLVGRPLPAGPDRGRTRPSERRTALPGPRATPSSPLRNAARRRSWSGR